MIRTSTILALLPCALLAAAPAQAYEMNQPACMQAFGFDSSSNGPPALPSQRALILPRNPTSSDVITVCTLDWVYPDHVSSANAGQRLTVTVFDNGFSWSPNPPIVIGETIGKLPAGAYALDAYVDASWSPRPPNYPYAIATNVAFVVAGGVAPAVSAPALGSGSILVAMVALAIAGILRVRRRRPRVRAR